MEPLIELIRQIDGADAPTIHKICEKINNVTYQGGFQSFIHIDKLRVYTCVSVTYDSDNDKIKNNYSDMLVIYGNKILSLACNDECDGVNIVANYYSTTYDSIKINNMFNFNPRNYNGDLIKHENVDTSWLFASNPIKSARNN